MAWDVTFLGKSITRDIGRGGPENLDFFGPWNLPKSRDFQSPPYSMALVTDLHPSRGEVSGTKCIYFVPLYIPQVYVSASELGLPTPLTRRRVSPPLIPCRGTLACGRGGGGGLNSDAGIYTVVLYMYICTL
jgi:hypothetical protein